MKTPENIFAHSSLLRFSRTIAAGDFLFREGDLGSSMILLVSGRVELQKEKRGQEAKLVSIVEAGQFVGEKALYVKGTYRRAFSAMAQKDSVVVELTNSNIDELQEENPMLLSQLLRHMFRTASLRLDRTNFMIRALHSSDNVKRLVHLIFYFMRSYGTKTSQGTEFALRPDAVRFYIDIEHGVLDNCVQELLIQEILIRTGDDTFLVTDEEKLLASASKLSQKVNSGHFDELESIP